MEGAGCERLVLYTNGAATVRCRFLSGGGSSGNNIQFTTSAATDGWIGCFVKTTNEGWNVQFWLAGASANGGVPKNITADGQWHVYEWNLDDNSGGADGWGSIAGIITGSVTVTDGSHYINSVIFRNPGTTLDATSVIYMDFVARYSDGTISNLVTQPCLGTPGLGITGPLSTNENIVRVTGVSSTATAITIYQGPNSSGVFTNLYSITVSSPGSTMIVTVPAGKLIKGAQVAATQTIGGQESCVPTSGVAVGGGASPSIRIAASIGQSGSVAGPVGRNAGGIPSNLYWIHSTGSGVAGGLTISPSTNWQTIVFYPTDSKYLWNGTFTFPDPNQYGVLDGFGIASADATDSGPIQIYFDNLRQVTNGTAAMIQNFEGNANGVNTVQFYQPSFSSTTSGSIDSTPNASVVSSTLAGGYASTGTNSESVNWQFANTGSGYLRLFAAGPNGNPATPYPVVDLTQPLLVDVLLLPVGQTASHSLGQVSPANAYQQTNCPGGSATLGVTVTPPNNTTPTYNYVWKHNGTAIPGATDATCTKTSLAAADSGTYSVTVSDGVTSATLDSLLTVPAPTQLDYQPTDAGVQPDGTGYAYFSAAASIPDTCPCAKDPAITYRWYFNGAPLTDAATITGSSGSGNSPVYPGLTINPTYYSNAGNYTLVVSNTCVGQVVTSAVAKLWVTPNAQVYAACQSQPGLLGLYYTNHTSASAFSGSPAWTNVDSSISYDWLAGGFEPGQFPIATDYFTIRWVGTLQTPYDPGTGQSYTFYTRSDDGVRLWVNGQLVIDKWILQGATTWTGSIFLTTNTPVNLILEYFEQTGNASVDLAYESLSMPSNSIPASQLCAAVPGQAGAGGIPPLLTLTAPTNNAAATFPATVILSANVTPQDATINKVEFYSNGTNLLGTVPAPGPYTTSWTPPSADVYNITTRVTYNTTSTLNSPSNKLTVALPLAAAVTITNISGTTLTYGGGNGAQFVLVKSATVNAPLNTWTRVATNTVTPGVFTIPAVGTETAVFYRVKSE